MKTVSTEPKVRSSDSTATNPATNGLVNALTPKPGSLIPAKAFQAVTFFDPKEQRQCIMLYALGQDGVIREFNQGKWNPFPITT